MGKKENKEEGLRNSTNKVSTEEEEAGELKKAKYRGKEEKW